MYTHRGTQWWCPDSSTSFFIRPPYLVSSSVCAVGGPVSQTPSPTGVATLPPLLVESTDDSISMCSNGIPGVESSNGLACCVAACGMCGGEGCSTVGLPDLDEEDCCVSEIVDFGMPCDTAGAAPCAIFGGGRGDMKRLASGFCDVTWLPPLTIL